jgi:hypothetical protein
VAPDASAHPGGAVLAGADRGAGLLRPGLGRQPGPGRRPAGPAPTECRWPGAGRWRRPRDLGAGARHRIRRPLLAGDPVPGGRRSAGTAFRDPVPPAPPGPARPGSDRGRRPAFRGPAGRAGPAHARGGRRQRFERDALVPARGAGPGAAQPPARRGRRGALRGRRGSGGARAPGPRGAGRTADRVADPEWPGDRLRRRSQWLPHRLGDHRRRRAGAGRVPHRGRRGQHALGSVQRRLRLPGGDLTGRPAVAARSAGAAHPDRSAGPGAGRPAEPGAALAAGRLVVGPGEYRRLLQPRRVRSEGRVRKHADAGGLALRRDRRTRGPWSVRA